jgi:hypothetical protein
MARKCNARLKEMLLKFKNKIKKCKKKSETCGKILECLRKISTIALTDLKFETIVLKCD